MRLEKVAASKPDDYVSFVCRGVAHWIRKQFHEVLAELEKAIPIKSEGYDAYFWKAMVCASLRRDEEAKDAIEMALTNELPPVLLSPLRWLEQDRPEFYAEYVVPLLAHFDV